MADDLEVEHHLGGQRVNLIRRPVEAFGEVKVGQRLVGFGIVYCSVAPAGEEDGEGFSKSRSAETDLPGSSFWIQAQT